MRRDSFRTHLSKLALITLLLTKEKIGASKTGISINGFNKGQSCYNKNIISIYMK